MTTSSLPYKEETFGILTDDDLYLDCVLVRPTRIDDDGLKTIRVWVPKYPLTKSSVIICARQETQAFGARLKTAHLVFDLRGTGESEGIMGDRQFDLDLRAIEAWAAERFGDVKVNFSGTPFSEHGRVNVMPLRPGSVMESYHYPAISADLTPAALLYLSSFGHFGRSDDIICTRLAQAGYDVYGADPLRYLLHASAQDRLKPDDLWDDLKILIQMLPRPPLLIGQPMAAGLVLMWACGIPQIQGVIAIGKAQVGLSPPHIFYNSNPYTYMLSRYVKDIAPRPLALVMHTGHAFGGDEQELGTLYKSSREPHRLEKINKLSFRFLTELIEWTYQYQP